MATTIARSLLISACFISSLSAKDFGVYGERFPIQENDLLEVLRKRISASSSEQTLEDVKELYVKGITHPARLSIVTDAQNYRRFDFDPTVVAQQDISDAEGKVIIPKGASVNPLKLVSMDQGLLFFDGSNEKQLEWARGQDSSSKWILIGGSPFDLSDTESRPVFFDQRGVLVKKLRIMAVPARVTQSDLKLCIEELPI
jgi:conjugal transfer pilus assembly protein TraW